MMSRYACEICGFEFDTADDAARCEQECAEFMRVRRSRGAPQCFVCDAPPSFDDLEGVWLQCEEHHDFGLHRNERHLVAEAEYEITQRLRGVQALPWEYPSELAS